MAGRWTNCINLIIKFVQIPKVKDLEILTRVEASLVYPEAMARWYHEYGDILGVDSNGILWGLVEGDVGEPLGCYWDGSNWCAR